MLPAPVDPLARVIIQAVRSDANIIDVAVGSGTPNLRDGGVRYFGRLVERITPALLGGISVEMVPPSDLDDLIILKDAGVTALIMSIEIWEDSIRREICPGKSEISKNHYRAAWHRAINMFGRGNVSSVILAGLDTVENIEAAIDEMTAMGVVPTIIPFRPYDASAMSNYPLTQVDDFLRVARHNASALLSAGLTPLHQAGCTKCQGCSIDSPEEWSASTSGA
jgi:biotin synthase-related radical SAM superfamily protein